MQQRRVDTLAEELWVVSFFSQQCVQKWFTGRFLAAAVRLNCYEDGINFGQMLGIVEAQNPAAVLFAVHVEDAEGCGVGVFSRLALPLSPHLEPACILDSPAIVAIQNVKNTPTISPLKY